MALPKASSAFAAAIKVVDKKKSPPQKTPLPAKAVEKLNAPLAKPASKGIASKVVPVKKSSPVFTPTPNPELSAKLEDRNDVSFKVAEKKQPPEELQDLKSLSRPVKFNFSSGLSKIAAQKNNSRAEVLKRKSDQPGGLSKAEASEYEKLTGVKIGAGTQLLKVPKTDGTTLKKDPGTGKRADELRADEVAKVALKQPSLTEKVKLIANAFGRAFNQEADITDELVNKIADEAERDAGKNPRDKKNGKAFADVIRAFGGAVTAPQRQTGAGLMAVSGGQTLAEKPRIVEGVGNIAFGALGNTPSGAAFNVAISHPEIQPLADQAFNLWGQGKEKVLSLPLLKELPSEVKDAMSLAADMYLFKKLDQVSKAPFKKTTKMQVTNPETGKVTQIKVPVDREWWNQVKTDVKNDVKLLARNPFEFIKEKQLGFSIKDVSTSPAPNTFKKIPKELQAIAADVAKFSTADEAYAYMKKRTDVPPEVAQVFGDVYGGGTVDGLPVKTQKQAFNDFFNAVKSSNKDISTTPANVNKGTLREELQKPLNDTADAPTVNVDMSEPPPPPKQPPAPADAPKPYDPSLSDKLMKEGSAKIQRRSIYEKKIDQVVTEWYDSNAALLKPNKEGEIGKSYLYAANFKTRMAENIKLGADDLKGLYGELPKKLQNVFDDIQVHKQLADRGKLGLKNPYDISEAQASARVQDVLAKLTPDDRKRIEAAETKVQKWKDDHIIQPMIENGIISKEMAAEWQTKYPNHLPVQVRHYLEASGYGDSGMSMKPSEKKFLSKAEGTESLLDTDTYRVRLRQLMQVRAAIEKDRVGSAILKDFGVALKDKVSTKESFEAKNPGFTFTIDPRTKQRYKIPKEVDNVISNLSAESMGIIENGLAKFSSLLRTGATSARVGFAVFTNPLRDPQNVKMMMGGKFSYARDWAPSLVTSLLDNLGIKKDAYKHELKKAGGLMSGSVTMEQVNKSSRELTPFVRQTPGQKIMSVVTKADPLYQTVKKFAESFEEGTRSAAAKAWDRLPPKEQAKVLKRLNPKYEVWVTGKDPAAAEDLRAFISKRSTLDFGQTGTKLKIVNRIIPFLNASQKGQVRTLALLKNDPIGFAVNTAKYAAIPTLLAYGWNEQFGGDGDIDAHTKQKYFTFKTGIKVQDEQGNDTELLITIPKGESGVQDVSNLLHGTLNAVRDKDSTLLENAYPVMYDLATNGANVETLKSLNRFIPSVPLLTPVMEAMSNWNFYKQRPIDSQAFQNIDWSSLSPEDMEKIKTPTMYKQLSSWSGASPFQVQNFMEGLFPAIGQYGTIADMAAGKGNASSTTKLFPLIRPNFETMKKINEVDAVKDQVAEDKNTNRFKIKNSIEQFLKIPDKEEKKKKTLEYIKSLPAEDQEYAVNYTTKMMQESGKTKTELKIFNLNADEAMAYYKPQLDEAIKKKDKKTILEIVKSVKKQSAQDALVDYVMAEMGATP